jgi:hypothetical protein
MITFDYVRIRQKVAIPAIQKFGTPITYTHYTSVHDPATGETARTPTTIETYGFLGGYKLGTQEANLVKLGDRRMITYGIPSVDPGDSVTIRGEEWVVVAQTNKIQPDGATEVISEIQIRRP